MVPICLLFFSLTQLLLLKASFVFVPWTWFIWIFLLIALSLTDSSQSPDKCPLLYFLSILRSMLLVLRLACPLRCCSQWASGQWIDSVSKKQCREHVRNDSKDWSLASTCILSYGIRKPITSMTLKTLCLLHICRGPLAVAPFLTINFPCIYHIKWMWSKVTMTV